MNVKLYSENGVLVAALSGEIDHHCCDEIRNEIDRALRLQRAEHLVMDFSDVTFMDSSGIGVVLGRYRKLKEQGGSVTIRNANRLVKQLLDLSGVFTLMNYEEKETCNGK